MKQHLNTLYVTLDNAYLHKDGQAIEVRINGERKLRIPLHNLESIVAFGWKITASAALMHGCAESGTSLSFLSPTGKFLASSYGGVSGNILLRKNQYKASEERLHTLSIAKNIVASKISNSRVVINRSIRDYPEKNSIEPLQKTSDFLKHRIRMALDSNEIDSLRGVEGDAAAIYFSSFNDLFTDEKSFFSFNGRNKRPPTDPFNALLSFLYVILMHDCKSACEGVGLDPRCGFLHRDRAGRFSLALDLSEEFRAFLADRLAFSLVNRKKILTAWQERKQNEIKHPYIGEKTTIGLIPHLQARLLARHLRGDLDAYPAFLWK